MIGWKMSKFRRYKDEHVEPLFLLKRGPMELANKKIANSEPPAIPCIGSKQVSTSKVQDRSASNYDVARQKEYLLCRVLYVNSNNPTCTIKGISTILLKLLFIRDGAHKHSVHCKRVIAR